MTTRISELTAIPALAPASQNALNDYCHFLLSTLPGDYAELANESALAGKRVSVARLGDIAEDLKGAHVIETYPVAAMVCAVAGRSTSERRKHESLKAWTLVACLALADRSPTVSACCRRIRRLGTEDDRWLFEELLETENELGKIVVRLNELLGEYSGKSKIDKHRYKKASALHALLADLHLQREKRQTGPIGRAQAGPTSVQRLLVFNVDDCLFPDIDNVRILCNETRINIAGKGLESRSASERFLDAVPVADYPTILKRQVRHGRALAQTFAMRSAATACAWEGLSSNEVRRAFDACFDRAIEGCRPSLWIMLSILLGRTAERLWSTPKQVYGQTGNTGEYWRVNKAKIQLVSYLSLPDFQLDHVDRQLVEPVYNCLLLPVPTSLTEPLRAALAAVWTGDDATDNLRSELRERIGQLNRDNNTRLTTKRLATYMHRELLRSGESDVVSKRLRGVDARVNYKQRYEANLLESSRVAYRQYATTLLAGIDRTDDWQESDCKPVAFGSQLRVKDDAIRYLFDDLRRRCEHPAQSFSGAVGFHNDFATHAHQLLMLASGHRPVRVPLDTLRSYDLVSRELFICDKAANRTSDSRTIVLPECASQQIASYIEHLQSLNRRCRRSAPELCGPLARALSGDGPLLFRIERDRRRRLTLVPFDPRHVNRWLQDDWTLPLNWHRHWLRSRLTELDQPHEYIDQFLGHEDDQPPGLGRYSNLTYSGRRSMASYINTMLVDLEVHAIGGFS